MEKRKREWLAEEHRSWQGIRFHLKRKTMASKSGQRISSLELAAESKGRYSPRIPSDGCQGRGDTRKAHGAVLVFSSPFVLCTNEI